MPSYRRPLAREVERFLPAFLAAPTDGDLLFERLDVLRGDGELMIMRTEATRFGLKPNVRPISSGEGTRFLITYAAMLKL